MLNPERTAADRIGFFVRVLFTTHSKRQSINDPDRRRELFGFQIFGFEILLVRFANVGNILAQQCRFAVLGAIGFALEGGLRRELHVFGLERLE